MSNIKSSSAENISFTSVIEIRVPSNEKLSRRNWCGVTGRVVHQDNLKREIAEAHERGYASKRIEIQEEEEEEEEKKHAEEGGVQLQILL